MYLAEVFVGAFGEGEVGGLVGVGADDDGDAELFHLLDEPLAGVEVGVAALVDAAGVDLADETQVVDEVHGLEGEVEVPGFILGEVAVAVVHDDFVGVSDDGGAVAFQHGVLLVEIGADAASYVAAKDVPQTVVVGLLSGPVDHP